MYHFCSAVKDDCGVDADEDGSYSDGQLLKTHLLQLKGKLFNHLVFTRASPYEKK